MSEGNGDRFLIGANSLILAIISYVPSLSLLLAYVGLVSIGGITSSIYKYNKT